MTPQQAALLIEMYDMREIIEEGEEREMMKLHNPSGLEAVDALKAIADDTA